MSFDDFGYLLPNIEILFKLKEHYPGLKVSLFTIPFPNQLFNEKNKSLYTPEKYKKWAKMINSYDWMEICIHGLYHMPKEFNASYERTKNMLEEGEKFLNKMGLKFVKVFKAPHWQYSWWALKALRDLGYIVALDRNNPIEVPEGTKTYYYNWSIDEKIPLFLTDLCGHGHMFEGQITNDLPGCFSNLLTMPTNKPFKFISEIC